MARRVQLIHCIHESRLEDTLRSGLKATSEFDDLGLEMRRGVVYCWLDRNDDKLSSGGQRPDYVYLEVTVDESRCMVADMDFSSLALMYRHGLGSKPVNEQVSALVGEAYRLTAVPLSAYTPGMFFTPEVLVEGDIAPECVRVVDGLDC